MKNAEAEDRIERRLAAALKSAPETWTADCLPPERMLALAERALPEPEAAPLMAHVALCARCRREYAETVELMQLAEEAGAPHVSEETPDAASPPVHALPAENAAQKTAAVRESPRRPFWQGWFAPGLGFALGAAAAGIALFFAGTVPMRVQRNRLASALKERESQLARANQETKALNQKLADVQRQGQGDTARLAGEIDRLNARIKAQGAQAARLAEAEETLRQMPLPTAAWKIARESGQLRGGGEPAAHAPEIAPLFPVETAVEDTRPALECRPVPGASDYRFSLEKEGSEEEIPVSQAASATQCRPASPLMPGTVYRWAVTATRGDKLLHSPFVKFYVLSDAQKQELAAARRDDAKSPLTLAAVYARLGMPAEAERQLRAALKADSTRAVAERWLKELEAERRQP